MKKNYDDDNVDQGSYLLGFNVGVKSIEFRLKALWLMWGIFIGLLWRL